MNSTGEKLKGRVAFITGGASGIGLGIAGRCGHAALSNPLPELREFMSDKRIKAEGYPKIFEILICLYENGKFNI